jgi:N-formylglutamate amidohydrolase
VGRILTETLLAPPLVHAPRGELPVLLSIPHSGRDYPQWLIELASAGRPALAALEDPLVDRLAWRALARGVGAVVARAPRAAVDCNRAEGEVDPALIVGGRRERLSARARGGLGIIPARTTQHGFLWRRAITRTELEARLAQAHRPYHLAIADQLGLLADRFGGAILLDCHSMPPPQPGVPGIVFGDCYGRTAEPWLSLEAIRTAADCGFSAGLNDPFAGGHVIARHADVKGGVQALQIEIDRSLYLDLPHAVASPGFDRVARFLDTLAVRLGAALLGRQFATAAE